ncbi:MAG: Gfo/Idh/MocA family oxidoreductase [Thermodesulfovibrionales bacterium]|jgi:predicted dehydrogenase|nr:Gfo/Idh/MocA family oxidoreductase [Thermodesulfovibrionales bacterium]
MINVGVIGVGYLGQHHARIYSELGSELGSVRLVGIVDTDRNRAVEISDKYGCEVYSDYRDILGSVDALSIVTPTTMHYQTALDCIKAGKDILIEKPITATVEEADRLIDAADKAGIIIQVGHLERFNPVFLAARSLMDKPVFIETERLSPFLGRGIDVDITLDLMIHDIDIIRALLKGSDSGIPDVKDMKVTGAKVLTDNIDIAMAWLEFSNGVQALMKASRVSFEKSRKLKIFQKDSYLLVDYQNMEIKRFCKKGSNEIIQETINIEKKEPLKEEIKDFAECVVSRRRPVVSATEGRDALKIALQIGEKIKK